MKDLFKTIIEEHKKKAIAAIASAFLSIFAVWYTDLTDKIVSMFVAPAEQTTDTE